jgi:hypothetical protein
MILIFGRLPLATGIEKDSLGISFVPVEDCCVVWEQMTLRTCFRVEFHRSCRASGGLSGAYKLPTFALPWTTDTSFDSLMTRIIVDQVFLDVKELPYDTTTSCGSMNILRIPATELPLV